MIVQNVAKRKLTDIFIDLHEYFLIYRIDKHKFY